MNHASLFSGIGGAEVAASWMGWHNAFHCEIQEFPRKVLEYWFPNSESYEDITKTNFAKWHGKVDVLTGGFPCQPFSLAGRRKVADDNRYLWPHMLRAIREIQPTWVVGENVAGIKTMVESCQVAKLGRSDDIFEENHIYREESKFTLDKICQDLEEAGYSVQPLVIPACAVGAPHRRDRVWIVAHRADARAETMQQGRQDGVLPDGTTADTNCAGLWERTDKQERIARGEGETHHSQGCENGTPPHTERSGGDEIHPQAQPEQPDGTEPHGTCGERIDADTLGKGLQGQHHHHDEKAQGSVHPMGRDAARLHNPIERGANRGFEGFPTTEPTIRRGNDGIPFDVDSLTISFPKWRQESIKAYGNAWVPQVAYEIFRAIEEISL